MQPRPRPLPFPVGAQHADKLRPAEPPRPSWVNYERNLKLGEHALTAAAEPAREPAVPAGKKIPTFDDGADAGLGRSGHLLLDCKESDDKTATVHEAEAGPGLEPTQRVVADGRTTDTFQEAAADARTRKGRSEVLASLEFIRRVAGDAPGLVDTAIRQMAAICDAARRHRPINNNLPGPPPVRLLQAALSLLTVIKAAHSESFGAFKTDKIVDEPAVLFRGHPTEALATHQFFASDRANGAVQRLRSAVACVMASADAVGLREFSRLARYGLFEAVMAKAQIDLFLHELDEELLFARIAFCID
ncbi:hypothetical protein VPH35_045936 [Triticum aestivum]